MLGSALVIYPRFLSISKVGVHYGQEDTQNQMLPSYHWQCKKFAESEQRGSGRIINQSVSSSHADLQMFHKLAKNSEIQSKHIMRLTNMCECSKEKKKSPSSAPTMN